MAGDNPDEHRLLVSEDGVGTMPSCVEAMPAADSPNEPAGKHLWVITEEGMPVVLETGNSVRPPPLASGRVTHTNLTGGGTACCGGEVWRDAADGLLLHVNGGSGRYPVRSPQHLADAVEVFAQFGYSVRSAGWDHDHDRAARSFRDG